MSSMINMKKLTNNRSHQAATKQVKKKLTENVVGNILTENVDKKLKTYLAEELAAYAAKEEFKKEKFDMDEIKTRLMFPVILFLVNIVVYLSSASFAWKSWQQLIDGSAGMSPFENEDDKPDSNPIE